MTLKWALGVSPQENTSAGYPYLKAHVCSQVSITAWNVCHQDYQTSKKSKSNWPTISGIRWMDIPHTLGGKTRYLPYMAGLGVATGSYNMLGIQMYVGLTKQFLEVWSKTQHNLPTSKTQMCMGAKPPHPMESTTVTGSSTVLHMYMYQYTHLMKESLYIKLTYWTETWTCKFNENAHNADVQEDQFGCLRHELRSNWSM